MRMYDLDPGKNPDLFSVIMVLILVILCCE